MLRYAKPFSFFSFLLYILVFVFFLAGHLSAGKFSIALFYFTLALQPIAFVSNIIILRKEEMTGWKIMAALHCFLIFILILYLALVASP